MWTIAYGFHENILEQIHAFANSFEYLLKMIDCVQKWNTIKRFLWHISLEYLSIHCEHWPFAQIIFCRIKNGTSIIQLLKLVQTVILLCGKNNLRNRGIFCFVLPNGYPKHIYVCKWSSRTKITQSKSYTSRWFEHKKAFYSCPRIELITMGSRTIWKAIGKKYQSKYRKLSQRAMNW